MFGLGAVDKKVVPAVNLILIPYLFAFLVTFCVAGFTVMTQSWHASLTADHQAGIQKIHQSVTPRVGGLAILIGLLVGWCVSPKYFFDGLFWPLLVASTPAFIFGFWEDVTKRVGVRARLLATLSSGAFGFVLTEFSITDVNFILLDWVLQFTFFSVFFTAVAVSGVANAVNIIDGLNGLAAGTTAMICGAFFAISLAFGDIHLSHVCLLIGSAAFGFLLFNWPFGKLFLGDGGAYLLGFSLAWIAVILLYRHVEISAWSPLLACSYPVLEVLFSMMRRRRRGLKVGEPDRLHLHSLVMRRLVMSRFTSLNRCAQNSLAGAVMCMFNVLPIAIAVGWPTNTMVLVVGLFLTAFIYSAFYARLTQFVWCFSAVTLRERVTYA